MASTWEEGEDEGRTEASGTGVSACVRVVASGHVMESSGGVDASSSRAVQWCSWAGEGTGSFVGVRNVQMTWWTGLGTNGCMWSRWRWHMVWHCHVLMSKGERDGSEGMQ